MTKQKAIPSESKFIIFFADGNWGFAPNRKSLRDITSRMGLVTIFCCEESLRPPSETLELLVDLMTRTRVIDIGKLDKPMIDILPKQENLSDYLSFYTDLDGDRVEFSCKLKRKSRAKERKIDT